MWYEWCYLCFIIYCEQQGNRTNCGIHLLPHQTFVEDAVYRDVLSMEVVDSDASFVDVRKSVTRCICLYHMCWGVICCVLY